MFAKYERLFVMKLDVDVTPLLSTHLLHVLFLAGTDWPKLKWVFLKLGNELLHFWSFCNVSKTHRINLVKLFLVNTQKASGQWDIWEFAYDRIMIVTNFLSN